MEEEREDSSLDQRVDIARPFRPSKQISSNAAFKIESMAAVATAECSTEREEKGGSARVINSVDQLLFFVVCSFNLTRAHNLFIEN